MATAEEIMQIRYELSDTDPAFPLLADAEYTYFIDKNEGSTRRAMLDCAKTILFKLSMRPDETVDIFSIKGSKAADAYREALKLFIKNPEFNIALTTANIFAGGISKIDMQDNLANLDNNAVRTPGQSTAGYANVIDPNSYFAV